MASSPVGLRPPWVKISQRGGSPGFDTRLASMATTMHWAPNLSAPSATNWRRCTAAVLIDTLSAPACSSLRMSSVVRTPPPTVSGMKQRDGRALDDVEDGVAVLVARRDVEEAQLVGAGRVVGGGRLDGIAGVLQVDEVDALDDAPVLDVEAGDDADFEHGRDQASVGASGMPRKIAAIASSMPRPPSGIGALATDKLRRQLRPRPVALPRPDPGARLVLAANEIGLHGRDRRVLLQLLREVEASSRRRQHLDDENGCSHVESSRGHAHWHGRPRHRGSARRLAVRTPNSAGRPGNGSGPASAAARRGCSRVHEPVCPRGAGSSCG